MKILLLLITSIILASCTASKPDKNLIPHFISPNNYDTITLGDTIKWTKVNGIDEYILYFSPRYYPGSIYTPNFFILMDSNIYYVIDSFYLDSRSFKSNTYTYWKVVSVYDSKEYTDYNILSLYLKKP